MPGRYAWADPAVDEVVPGIYRIPLPLPMDGLRAVNVYLIKGPDGVTLIDGGWWVPEALARLRAALDELGVDLADLGTVLATHFHRDHYTLAVLLRQLTGCELTLGEGERDSLDVILSGANGRRSFGAMLARAGFRGRPEDLVPPPQDRPDVTYEPPTRWLKGDEVIVTAAHELHVIPTPGHTQGHLCFADATASVLFAGDHVLPQITPSIGFEVAPAHLPLGDYLSSLALVRSRPDTMLLPAHGPVTGSVHERIDELLAHHAERLDRCGDAAAGGRETAYEVASVLPWTRHQRALDELDPFSRFLAIHETLAHLDVLVVQGRLRSKTIEGTDHFSVA
jgi:glyoxylase-like metal-dependent hydrolase (beta-lactamase superfamily II)